MSLDGQREPIPSQYPHEPIWDFDGARLPDRNPEPVGYLEKLSLEERNVLARGRLRFRAGGERWVGGKSWHVESARRGVDIDRRGKPVDDRRSKRPDIWTLNLDE